MGLDPLKRQVAVKHRLQKQNASWKLTPLELTLDRLGVVGVDDSFEHAQ